jgi:hypothetical protein
VSVDTYLTGKDTSAYARVVSDDVEVLVAPALARLTRRLDVRTRGAAFWRGFAVDVEHEHGTACACSH